MHNAIPFEDFGGNGPTIHLAHANGFPAGSYRVLTNELTSEFHVIGMQARPLWPNSDHRTFRSWYDAADDLIQFLDSQGWKNIIGMGHSFGAICTVIAANKRPDLFSKLVLIEPVVLPNFVYQLTRYTPKGLLKKINPVAKKALQRKDRWKSRQAAFDQFRAKKVFSLMSDEALWDYVNSVMTDDEQGIRLNYHKRWEAQIFMTVPDPWQELARLKHPFIAFRGETSDTIQPKVWDRWKKINSTGKLVEIPQSGHMVPMERPSFLAEQIIRFLQ